MALTTALFGFETTDCHDNSVFPSIIDTLIVSRFADANRDHLMWDVPPGIYTARIEEVSFVLNPAENAYIDWHFLIEDAEYQGHSLFLTSTWSSPSELLELLLNLDACGVSLSLSDLPELPERLRDLVQMTVLIHRTAGLEHSVRILDRF